MISGVGPTSNRSGDLSLPGGLQTGSYRSESSGAKRTVVVVPPDIEKLLPKSPTATISASRVEKMRSVVKARYGAAVAKTAFREIDYRQSKVERGFLGRFGIKSAKDVRGHHLTTAVLRALELASPKVGATMLKETSETTLARLEPVLQEKEQQLQEKKQEREQILEHYSPINDSFYLQRLEKEISELEPQVEDLRDAVDQATKDQETATRTLEDFRRNPLGETALGKAQQSLDQVDGDPRFRRLLNDVYARGQALHGKGGTAHRMTPTSKTPSTAVKEVVKIGLPPVGVAMAFHSAIKAEDRQRRLGNAAKFLDDHPFAQSLAKSLEAGAEEKKNKAAIVGTVSFVAMGATAHLALIAQPGLKAIGNPITAAVGRGVSHELTGHMSHVGTQVMSTSSSNVSGRVVSEVQNRTATSVMPSGPGVSRTTKAEPIEVPLPEGTSAPTIPVQIQTDEGPRTKEFDMSTAGPALLHYVGSQVGDTSDPHEQNRKELRDLLGARPEDDFDPNRKASPEDRELDERIAAALDDPTQPGAAELIRSVSPLRLLYIAQGWR